MVIPSISVVNWGSWFSSVRPPASHTRGPSMYQSLSSRTPERRYPTVAGQRRGEARAAQPVVQIVELRVRNRRCEMPVMGSASGHASTCPHRRQILS